MSARGPDAILSWATAAVREHDYTALEATAALARAFDANGRLSGHPIFDRVDRLPSLSPTELERTANPADQLGQVYEQLLDAAQRRSAGSHFTPPAIATGLVELAVSDWPLGPASRVCDPAVGAGAFLLAAARALESRGEERPDIVAKQLFGTDLNADALTVADAALVLWSDGAGAGDHLRVGDALNDDGWDLSFDLVVGNPPFLNQLATATARTREQAAALQERFGAAAMGYVDDAALLLLAGLDLLDEQGRLLMVQPQSTLAATAASAVRKGVQDVGHVLKVWLGSRETFEADVEVCAVLVEVGSGEAPEQIAVYQGPDFQPVGAHATADVVKSPGWGVLLAATAGVPDVEIADAGTLGTRVDATAGFRDQFYGLAPHTVEEAPDHDLPRLLTVGMIDPARNRWGSGSFRFDHKRWTRPVVDIEALADLDPVLGAWVESRLRPKVCVATQTRLIEATVDVAGRWVPATPVIAVHCDPEELWLVAAALMAPPVTAWAQRRHAGAALNSDALRLSARQIQELPLPLDRSAWEIGAGLVEQAQTAAEGGKKSVWADTMAAFGRQMCEAYEVESAMLLEWWEERFPPWR